ncbi:hypothetical protein ACH6CV_16540 [Bacillota bacterium Meth-B3]
MMRRKIPNNEPPRYKRDPLGRRIEILRLLHGKKMRTAEIAECFKPGCDQSYIRTIQRDLEDLRDGINVLGTTIRIEETTESHSLKSYQSTVHPIFLALNLTELTALLKLLEERVDDPVYGGIFESIYNQLTDYAEERVIPLLGRRHVRGNATANRLDQEYVHTIHYLLKSQTEVDITYTTRDGDRITRKCMVRRYDDLRQTLAFRNIQANCTVERPLAEIEIDWSQVAYR